MKNFDTFIERCAQFHEVQVNSLKHEWLEALKHPQHWMQLKSGKSVSIKLADQTYDELTVKDAINEMNHHSTGWVVKLDGTTETVGHRIFVKDGAVTFRGR